MKKTPETEETNHAKLYIILGAAFVLLLAVVWLIVFVSQNRVHQSQDAEFKFRDAVCINDGFYKDQCGTITALTDKGTYIVDLGFEGKIEAEPSLLRRK